MKFNFKLILIVLLNFVICIYGYSQRVEDRTELEKRKTETVQQIEYTRRLLESTRKSSEVTLNQVNLINRNIRNREELVNNLDSEILIINQQIQFNEKIIQDIQEDLTKLLKEYERIIVATYRNIEQGSYLEYILGAEDINQGYQRIKHIKYINDYRKRLHSELLQKKEQLHDENLSMEKLVTEIQTARDLRENELGLLTRERHQKQSSINQLRQKERQLIAELKEKESIQRKLEAEINRIVAEEIRRSKENNVAVLTPGEKLISGDFVKNMGRLPWPVERGVITGHFGEHPHPVIKGFKVKSNGIDINTTEGTKARCVFDGEVTRIVAILGANYNVIVKHGEFYSVYTNLININVKAGDLVRKNDYIGTIYTDKNQTTKLHFQIWRDRVLQDPERWLAK